MSEEALKPKPLAIAQTLTAGGKALGIIPQTFDDCYRMGKLMALSGLVPDSFKNNAEACCVAIMQGLEVGLSPMAALQSIAVINGRPSLWGDGALAVVRASGKMEWLKEWTEDTTAYCEAKRKGEDGTVLRSFSDADAKAAGLLNKKGPWQDYRPRMRQMRARSWVLRDGFSDILKGLHIAEEAQDIPMRDITPPQPQRVSSYQAKRDGFSVDRFNELRKKIAESGGAIECQELWVGAKEDLKVMARRWFDIVAEEFIYKMQDHGVSLDVDDTGWPVLIRPEDPPAPEPEAAE